MKLTVITPAVIVLAMPGWLAAQSGTPCTEPCVVQAEKGWQLSGRELSPNHHVDKDAVLSCKSANQDAIIACGSAGWILHTCSKPDGQVRACDLEGNGVSSGRVDAMAGRPAELRPSYFGRESTPRITAAVRGGREPNDALLLQTAQGIHWGPALDRILEGEYCFRLTRLPAAGSHPLVFQLKWDRRKDREGVMAVPAVTPGTYTLEKGTPDPGGCRIDPDATAAWVLIASESNFNRASGQWQTDTAWTNKLEESGTSLMAVTTVRHALLASLADSLVPR
jgi:hypothetical protein